MDITVTSVVPSMSRRMTKTIALTPELHEWLVGKKRGNETIDDTLRRLLIIKTEGEIDAGTQDTG